MRLDEVPTPQEDRVRFLTTTGAQLASFGKVDEGIGFLEKAAEARAGQRRIVRLAWRGDVPERPGSGRSLLKQSISAGTRLVRPMWFWRITTWR